MQGITAASSQTISSFMNSWKRADRQNTAIQSSPPESDRPNTFSPSDSGVLGHLGLEPRQDAPQENAFWTTREFQQTYLALMNQGLDYGIADSKEGVNASSSAGTTVNLKRHVTGKSEQGGGAQATYAATITTASGLHLELELSDDARITDLEDGGISVTYRGSGETHIYDAAGNKTVRKNESDAFAGTDKDDIFINLRGTEVDGGAGNDTIISFADNATLRGGEGDDKIILARNVEGNTIDTGNGNDSLTGQNITASHIDMGEGDNTVRFSTLAQGSTMTLGNGNNTIDVRNVWDGSSVTAGNGDNTLNMNSIRNNSSMTIGDGNNTLDINSVYENSSMTIGDGNNTMEMVTTHGNSSVIIGDGDNVIDAGSVTNGSTFKIGDGNNNIETGNIYKNSSAIIGDGNNTIKSVSTWNNSSLKIGYGNNKIEIHGVDYKSSATIGNGENSIYIDHVTRGSEVNISNKRNSTHISYITSSYINAGTENRKYSLGQYIRV